MTSVISLHNTDRRSLWLNMYFYTLRKNIPMCVLYFVIFFLAMPFVLILNIMTESVYVPYPSYVEPFISFNAGLLLAMFIIGALASIITGFAMHRHLFSKKAMDVFGALPIKRASLFTSRYAAGLTLLAVPMLLNIIATVTLAVITPAYNVAMAEVFKQSVTLFICFLTCYTFTSFIISGSGTVLDSMISIIIFGAAGTGFYMIYQYLMSAFFYGVYTDVYFNNYLTPYASAVNLIMPRDIPNLIWWLVITAAMFAGSVILSRRRKPEKSGTPHVYRGFGILIKGITAMVGGLVGGIMMRGVFYYDKRVWPLILGFMIFSALAFAIFEVIVSRGFKSMLRNLPVYGIVVGVFFAVLLGVGIFTKGYETRLPDPNKISSVEFDDGYDFGSDRTTYKDPESIQAVYDMHKNIVEAIKKMRARGETPEDSSYVHNPPNNDYSYGGDYIYIKYHLKNGTSFTRRYQVSRDVIAEPHDRLTKQREYRLNVNHVFDFKLTGNDFTLVLNDVFSMYGNTQIPKEIDKAKAAELLEGYKQDLLDETAEQANLRTPPVYFLTLESRYDGGCQMKILPHYTRSMEFMEKYGYGEGYSKMELDNTVKMYVTGDFPVSAENYIFDGYNLYHGYTNNYMYSEDIEPMYTYAEISDRSQMEQLIEAAGGPAEWYEYDYHEGDYLVTIFTPEASYGTPIFIAKENAPAFLKSLKYDQKGYY